MADADGEKRTSEGAILSNVDLEQKISCSFSPEASRNRILNETTEAIVGKLGKAEEQVLKLLR